MNMIPAAVNLLYHKKSNRDSSININISTTENHDLSKQSMQFYQTKYCILLTIKELAAKLKA